MKSFLVCAGLCICSLGLMITGYVGNVRQNEKNYEILIDEGLNHTIQGDYESAASAYTKAITDVDGSRNTAYMELLNLYVNYMDDPEAGLSRVTNYIDEGYGNIQKDSALLMTVAMDYFDVMKDYKSSAYYFNLIDKKEHPEAAYYSSIALAMGELNVDYGELSDNLVSFEEINDSSAISINKLMNYRLLCVVYSRNMTNMKDAANRLILSANKGLALLEEYEDDSVKAEYYTVFHQYMALAYEQLGDDNWEKNESKAKECYSNAIRSCDFILNMVALEETSTIGTITDTKLREAKYCQKAQIYQKMGDMESAKRIYEQAEQEFSEGSIALYAGHLSLLCKIEESKNEDIEKWNYKVLHDLYQKGNKVKDISNDYRWKQLTLKLAPLFEKKGE